MSYLSLTNPTTNSCEFEVKLSNSFNKDYYKELRITKHYFGKSTSDVSSFLESRTARRNYSSNHVSGVVNEGLHAGKSYTLYAYAQAANGTWYLAGSDTIKMKDEENTDKEFDYGIKSITPDKTEPFKIGDEVEFTVEVKNYKKRVGPRYKVLLQDKHGINLDYDNEPALEPKGDSEGSDINNAYLTTTIESTHLNSYGQAEYNFLIKPRESGFSETDDSDNTKTRKYEVKDNSDPIDNIKNDTSLGLTQEKKDTLVAIGSALIDEGYETAFVAGVLGNTMHEANVGSFESSAYISHPEKEPDYLKYVDEHYNYREDYSGRNIKEVGIAKAKTLIDDCEKVGYKGKFGFGCIQWTGSRCKAAIDTYISQCGENSFPTSNQCNKAESAVIIKELKGKDYKTNVYDKWVSDYKGNDKAAYYAGYIVCTNYENPLDCQSKVKTRANSAEEIYNVMMGLN